MSSDELTANALFSNALKEIRSAHHIEALAILDKLLEIAPEDPRAFFLRGAEQAELGRFDEAISDLRRATNLNPQLWTAHFELGLIFYLGGNYPNAAEAWFPLTALPPLNSFRLFVNGLMLFAQNKRAEAIQCVELGIQSNSENPALSQNMQKILSILEVPVSNVSASDDQQSKLSADAKHVLLNNYDQLTDKSKS
jgi:tetratricopeptide (TPR) repeat protein